MLPLQTYRHAVALRRVQHNHYSIHSLRLPTSRSSRLSQDASFSTNPRGQIRGGWTATSNCSEEKTTVNGSGAPSERKERKASSISIAESQVKLKAPLKSKARSKKEKISVDVWDLPQGLLPLEPLVLEKDLKPTYPTVVNQALQNIKKFENCVLLTRVGGFYELYFEHADEYGPLLGLKVAQKKTNAGLVSMSGFPFFQLDRYLKILVQDLNRYVAIAEEFPNSPSDKVKSGGLMHDRKVSRVVTPGTLIDEDFMDPLSNNYVLAIHLEIHRASADIQSKASETNSARQTSLVGLAWLDLSTGHFFTQTSTLTSLPSFISRIGPREIVLNENLQDVKNHEIFSILQEEGRLISYVCVAEDATISTWEVKLESPISLETVAEITEEEIVAGSCLLQYIDTRLRGSNIKIQPPTRQHNVVGIDKSTMRALEIRKTLRDDNFVGSLLHSVRRTITRGGARLLENWLTSPSTSVDVINSRLDLVSYFLNNEELRECLVTPLRKSHDSHRLLQKFAFGRGDPDDLLDLASTIFATQELGDILQHDASQNTSVADLTARLQLETPGLLATRIMEAIDTEGLAQQHRIEDGEAGVMQELAQGIINLEGSKLDEALLPKGNRRKAPASIRDYYSDENESWVMKPVASPKLTNLHSDLVTLKVQKQDLANDLSTRLGVTSLTLRCTPGLGHICHVKGKDIKMDISDVKNVSSSKSTRSFQHPEWSKLGEVIDRCRVHIRAEEQQVFDLIRKQVLANMIKLRKNAAVIDELDVTRSLAALAAEKNWTRPILNHSRKHNIVGGRHPTVEGGLEEEGRSFIRNDCSVGNTQQTWLVTGPNAGGKSTFLRQNALITILAQVGSYVPAQYAEIGIVDQVFSRVGSADNLFRAESTFMVEMLETAVILKNATSKSFVIVDELGRGTTPQDGTAVAFACLNHLYHINKCRTLFATHFHALADMVKERQMGGVGFYCTDVEESKNGDGFRYVHRLREGVNRQSHALKVARLAGLPEEAIKVAKELLSSNRKSV